MKKLVVSKENPCKACLSCVIACSEAFYKKFDPELSCIQIVAKAGDVPKVNTCIMCGKCARTCPEQAISQNAKGVYMIDKKKYNEVPAEIKSMYDTSMLTDEDIKEFGIIVDPDTGDKYLPALSSDSENVKLITREEVIGQ